MAYEYHDAINRERQREVLNMLLNGFTEHEIAAELGATLKDVRQDFAALRANWRQTMAIRFDAVVIQLFDIKRRAQEAFKRSQGIQTEITEETITKPVRHKCADGSYTINEVQEKRRRVTRRQGVGDPRFLNAETQAMREISIILGYHDSEETEARNLHLPVRVGAPILCENPTEAKALERYRSLTRAQIEAAAVPSGGNDGDG